MFLVLFESRFFAIFLLLIFSFIKFRLVNSIVILSSAQSQVDIDIDKLFHANPPSLSPNGPTNVQRPLANQNNDRPNDDMAEVFDPFRGSRHDEFDWSLTKVSNIS